MSEKSVCPICQVRRARRECPAIGKSICAPCCGAEREESIACPLDCEYLAEAHLREKTIDRDRIPNEDVQVGEEFLRQQEEPLMFVGYALLQAASRTPGAVDQDVLEALEAMIKTRRTLESGLIYESRTGDAISAAVQTMVERSLTDYQKVRAENAEGSLRNSDVLGILIFLQRLGLARDNGRRRGRAFIDFLRRNMPETPAPDAGPALIL